MKIELPFPPPPADGATLLKQLKDRYPDVTLWFGKSTRHYWALVNNQLIEADTPEQLGSKIDEAGPRTRWQRRPRYGQTNTEQGDTRSQRP